MHVHVEIKYVTAQINNFNLTRGAHVKIFKNYLSSDLIAALASLNVDDFSHCVP